MLVHLREGFVLQGEQSRDVGLLDPAYAGVRRTVHTLQDAFRPGALSPELGGVLYWTAFPSTRSKPCQLLVSAPGEVRWWACVVLFMLGAGRAVRESQQD